MDYTLVAIHLENEAKLLRHNKFYTKATLYENTAKNLRLISRLMENLD